MSDAVDTLQPISLNRRIKEMKLNLKALQQRLDEAEPALAKAESALRNMTLAHAKEKARADRAEAQLRSLGVQIVRAA